MEKTKTVYDETKTYRDGKWVMFPLVALYTVIKKRRGTLNLNDKSCFINAVREALKRPYNRGRIAYYAPWAKIASDEVIKHTYENNKIVYKAVGNDSYVNHIEMAGKLTAAIISYGMNSDNVLKLNIHAVYPTLRYNPNLTHNSFDNNFKGVKILENGKKVKERVTSFEFDGILTISGTSGSLKITREFFACNFTKAVIEKITITNTIESASKICIKKLSKDVIVSKYAMANSEEVALKTIVSCEEFELAGGETKVVNVAYCGEAAYKQIEVDFDKEYLERKEFLKLTNTILAIETPSEIINNMTKFAKIRFCESIFQTKNGLMHSPGGGGYYAALWTNDQCEYANPLFGYMGYQLGIEQSINCYNLYKKYISDKESLITSIISEGDNIWNGAKDRGDSAMYAYGLARFLLARGDFALAKSYLPYLEKCLNYTISQINEDGVIKSDSDELENRFESGKANLCTSCLAFDAFNSNAYLFRELNETEKAENYRCLAEELAINIEKYFGATVEGFETYRYCKEESRLRSWICMPLCVGINNRKDAVAEALMSDKIRKGNSFLTRSGGKTFWDRSLLYALRGLFSAGFADRAMELMESYSKTRLYGCHIPYAVEAFPEGNQAQLSAESGLYIRIVTEGIIGLRLVGLGKFTINPNLPESWDRTAVNNISIGDKFINIKIAKQNGDYEVSCVYGDGKSVKNESGVWHVIE